MNFKSALVNFTNQMGILLHARQYKNPAALIDVLSYMSDRDGYEESISLRVAGSVSYVLLCNFSCSIYSIRTRFCTFC